MNNTPTTPQNDQNPTPQTEPPQKMENLARPDEAGKVQTGEMTTPVTPQSTDPNAPGTITPPSTPGAGPTTPTPVDPAEGTPDIAPQGSAAPLNDAPLSPEASMPDVPEEEPISPASTPAPQPQPEPKKGNWFTRLFGGK